jgi:phage terminase large subunit
MENQSYNPNNDLREFSIVDTTATQKIFDLKKRIRAVAGGTSASKTVSILIWLIDYCQTKQTRNKLVTVTSESYPHLLGGAIHDFEVIMKDRGYWKEDRWVRNPVTVYTFETGNQMEFKTFDSYSKAHGSRRDVLFVNEGNNMSYNIVDQLMVRTREVVWLDWNPTNEFWFYTNLLNHRDDIDFITLTYKDNEALDETTIQEIESHKNNKAWWLVYGLGQLGQVEGRIYTNWEIIDEVPFDAVLKRRGLDFGYSIDPTVIEDIYIWNNGYVFDQLLYQKGMSNRSIADVIANQPLRALTVADSAEPKSIAEIASYGIPIIGAKKGAGSVLQGIQYVQDQKIYITKRSVETLKAYRNYLWTQDKDGKFINEPDDTIHEWSNSMDAIRYGMDSLKATLPKPLPTTYGGVQPFIEGVG